MDSNLVMTVPITNLSHIVSSSKISATTTNKIMLLLINKLIYLLKSLLTINKLLPILELLAVLHTLANQAIAAPYQNITTRLHLMSA
jgi:hypothetical protein